jgi:1,4-dihydroxy-2-naphthoate octaprenyltransferase
VEFFFHAASLTLLSAMLLIYYAFRDTEFMVSLFSIYCGNSLFSITIRYTVGNTACSFVDLVTYLSLYFFGLVSTLGVNFLYSKQLDALLVL